MDTIIRIMDIIGIIAAAVSGTLVAIGASLDMFGVIFVGCITAFGGGITRDLLLGINPPSIFTNFATFSIALITSVMVFALAYINRKRFNAFKGNIEYINNFFDAIGLAAFTIIGSEVCYKNGFADNAFVIIMIGMIAGVGGGVFRDILTDRTPYILKKHVYASASILGSLMYCIMKKYVGNAAVTSVLPMLLIIIIRMMATKYRWSFPKIHIDSNK